MQELSETDSPFNYGSLYRHDSELVTICLFSFTFIALASPLKYLELFQRLMLESK